MQVTTDLFTKVVEAEFKTPCVKEFRFHPVRKWRFDYALPDLKIAIEVEGGVWIGGRHTSGAGFVNDMEKYNHAVCLGWRLLRVTPTKLMVDGTFYLKLILNNG